MATNVVSEGRKLNSEGNGHGENGHGDLVRAGVKRRTAEEDDSTLVLDEIMRLVDASKEGRLAERGKATLFNGVHREMIQGVNEMLDAILLPIGEGNRVLAQISSGKIDELITQNYKGDHEKMKVAVNNVAQVVQGLQTELTKLSEAAKAGHLSERGKPEQFQGAYSEIVRGVNGILDAVNALVADAGLLSKAAVDGKLATRADASKHQGDYRKIVQGVDDCLDAVIGPLNVAANYVDRISRGDIPAKITDTYNGDFNVLK